MSAPLHAIDSRLKQLALSEQLIRRNPFYYEHVRRELAALDRSDGSGSSVWSEKRLSQVLSAAARTAYGERVGAPQALKEWPLLSKEDVRSSPESFKPRRGWAGRWFNARAATGGTTGAPLALVRSPESIVVEQVCQDMTIAELGIEPDAARVAVLRADSIKDPSDAKPPYWIRTHGGRRLILSSNHLSAETLPHYVDAIRRFAPDLLWVYPTALESLCLLLQHADTRLHAARVLSSSEMLRPEVWRLAHDTLGCAIADRYGQAERVACAHAFTPGAYRFVPGYAHVELIPDSADESNVSYEIVGTSLWNAAMPLVRYRTGDLVCLPRNFGERELHEITNGIRTFNGVIGRVNDILLAPGGTGVLTGVNHIPRGVANLMRLQVVQHTPAQVVLRVLAAPAFSEADASRLVSNARMKIPDSIDVRVEVGGPLHRTKGGKTPFIVHGPAVRQAFRRLGLQAAGA